MPRAGWLPHLLFPRRLQAAQNERSKPRRLRGGAKFCGMKEHRVSKLRVCGSLTFMVILPLAKLEPRGSARAGGSGSQDN